MILKLEAPETRLPKDTLHIRITQEAGELWKTSIPVMLGQSPPTLPRFGAVELKLRYDLPITINQGEGGKLGNLTRVSYDEGWNPALKDVLVCLPTAHGLSSGEARVTSHSGGRKQHRPLLRVG